MPLGPVQAQRIGIARTWVVELRIEGLQRLLLHGGFDFATFPVQSVELGREAHGCAFIIGQQAGDADGHIGEAARGIQARSGDETKVVRGRAMRIAASNHEQGAHARLHTASANALEPMVDEDAVRVVELNHIGDSTQRDQVEERSKAGLLAAGEVTAFA